MEILETAFHLAMFCIFMWVLSLIWRIRNLSDIAITRIAEGSLLLLGILSPLFSILLFSQYLNALPQAEALAISSVFAAFFILSALAVWRRWKAAALLLRISTLLIYAAVGVHVALCISVFFAPFGDQNALIILWLIFFVAPIAIPILFLFTILSIYFPPPRPQFLKIWRTPSAARLPDRLKR